MSDSFKKIPILEPASDEESHANADKESTAFANETDLRKLAEESQHGRSEDLKDLIHCVAKIVVLCVFVILLLMGLSFSWHLIAPDKFRYLSEAQINDIRNILFSGLVASAASAYFRKNL